MPAGTAYCWAHVDDDCARAHPGDGARGDRAATTFLPDPRTRIVEALEIAQSITGIPAPKLRLPPAVLKTLAALLTPIDAIFPLPPGASPEALRVLAGVTYLGSAARAKTELGWQPRPLEEGLTETLLHERKVLGLGA